MTDGPSGPWDDDTDDDHDDHDASSALGVFDEYVPAPAADRDDAEEPALPEADEGQELSSPLYTITNPAGTVSVTVCLDGRVHHVELAPKVTDMSERELADEIRIIADLARQKARSQLHALIVEGVRVMGYDPAIMRDGLSPELDMPTPEEAEATVARVFASRYATDHEQGDR